jgi:hypothetical protein
MLEAIERLRNAVNEAEKRQAARDLGAAIGAALGTAATIYRTPEQIDAMSLAEIDAWVEGVQMEIGT